MVHNRAMDSTVLDTNRERNMTTTRDDLITIITEQLGNVATRDDGEQVFDYLHNLDQIVWDDRDGYVLAADADVIQAYEKATAQKRGNATYRAAYWLSADKQADVRLTDRTQADLPDDQLLAAAMATAAEVGLEIGDGSIEIGDFTE